MKLSSSSFRVCIMHSAAMLHTGTAGEHRDG